MLIRKRNGHEDDFKKSNIIEAISKANQKVRMEVRLTPQEIKEIAKTVEDKCKQSTVAVNVEDIQKMVKLALHEHNKPEIEEEYTTYRDRKLLADRKNTIDDRILSLLNSDNEDIQQENANKNPNIVSTMRDYMARRSIKGYFSTLFTTIRYLAST